MTEYLSPTDLHDLTGYARPTQQARWLKDKGIAHRVDGKRVIVSRAHAREWLEGKHVPTGGLNMAAIA